MQHQPTPLAMTFTTSASQPPPLRWEQHHLRAAGPCRSVHRRSLTPTWSTSGTSRTLPSCARRSSRTSQTPTPTQLSCRPRAPSGFTPCPCCSRTATGSLPSSSPTTTTTVSSPTPTPCRSRSPHHLRHHRHSAGRQEAGPGEGRPGEGTRKVLSPVCRFDMRQVDVQQVVKVMASINSGKWQHRCRDEGLPEGGQDAHEGGLRGVAEAQPGEEGRGQGA